MSNKLNDQYINLDTVTSSLKTAPVSFEQLWSDFAAFWQQLNWQPPQLKLWLACLPGIITNTTATGEQTYQLAGTANTGELCLADEMAALLEKAGRPMPLAQLLAKLPAGMVVTEPMLRAAAQADARLELKGPLVKLATT